MDYSKKGGGTRVHDKAKIRTLATGIGQTHAAMRETGSMRMSRVLDGMKPGQIGLDQAMKPHAEKRDADAAMYASMHMDQPVLAAGETSKWPLSTGSCSQDECGDAQKTKSDQGEQTRVPTTGGKRIHPIMQTPLRLSGK
jgi:hypothetical protein